MINLTSDKLFHEAKRYIPGGVNSPVRAFKAVGGYPVFVDHANGSKIYDEFQNEYIDYCQSFGALILGHAHPAILQVLNSSVNKGTSFGMPTKNEIEFAKLIIKAIPSIEKIRLTNSGTEAVMGAIRLARAYTGKNKIIRFDGSYHGHADYLLNCPGVPQDFTKHTLVAPYNNINKVQELIEQNKEDVAGIIVEPVAGNMGVVLPKEEFLIGLREVADKYNIVLIFDEVITGFRLIYGGAQNFFDIQPDLTCLGKIIGGGLPVGAFGGKSEIMQLLAPEGAVYQAGTFSGNPLTVSAGIATLRVLEDISLYSDLEKRTRMLCENIKDMADKSNIKINVNYIGSMFSFFFTEQEVIDYDTAKTQDIELFKKFYHELLNKGIYFSPSGFEANFLSTAHTNDDLEKTLKAVEETFRYWRIK